MPMAAGTGDLLGVLRIAPFRRLWISLTLSSLGDWLGLLATTALAQQLGGSYRGQAYAIGGVLALRLLPAVVFGPLAGAVADRFDRKRTMVMTDLLRFALFVSIPAVGTLWWLLVSSFLIECLSLFWIPAKEASVPNLVPPERLEAANTLSLISTYGSAAVAAGLFALLSILSRALAVGIPFFHTNQVDLALYFDGGTFLFSAVTIFTLSGIGKAKRAKPDEPPPGVLVSIKEGFVFVRHDRVVRGLVVGILGGFTGAGAVVALGRLYAADVGAGDAGYGLLFGAIFVGMALGMAGGPRLLGSYSRRRLFGISVMCAGACLMVVAILPNLNIALSVVLLVGVFAGIAWVTGYTLLGLQVADEVRGRTFALVQSLVRVDLLLVLAVAPVIVGLIGPHSIHLPNGASIRADGVTVVLLLGGLTAVVVGHLAFKEMDDRPGVPIIPELWASLRGRKLRSMGRPYTGFFIVLEGGEGAGKSTQARRLARALAPSGTEIVVTAEPGGTPAGKRLRELLLDSGIQWSDRAEALLYAADRAEHVTRVLRPALERGAIVISDRYADSSLAYQGGGRELGRDEVARLSEWATDDLVPDLTLLLDMPVDAGLARARNRGKADRLEEEALEFHERVRRAFLRQMADDPSRYVHVDASPAEAEVAQAVRSAVLRALPPELRPRDEQVGWSQ